MSAPATKPGKRQSTAGGLGVPGGLARTPAERMDQDPRRRRPLPIRHLGDDHATAARAAPVESRAHHREDREAAAIADRPVISHDPSVWFRRRRLARSRKRVAPERTPAGLCRATSVSAHRRACRLARPGSHRCRSCGGCGRPCRLPRCIPSRFTRRSPWFETGGGRVYFVERSRPESFGAQLIRKLVHRLADFLEPDVPLRLRLLPHGRLRGRWLLGRHVVLDT